MNTKTAFIMFAVIAAFGLVAATVVVPLVNQAYAQGQAPCFRQGCQTFGLSHNPSGHGPP